MTKLLIKLKLINCTEISEATIILNPKINIKNWKRLKLLLLFVFNTKQLEIKPIRKIYRGTPNLL